MSSSMIELERLTAHHSELSEVCQLLRDHPKTFLKNGLYTAHIGQGYFAEYSETEAIEFLGRQISRVESKLFQLRELTGFSEEGLPIMDICEILDDNGNVVSAEVQPSNLALSSMASALQKAGTGNAVNAVESSQRQTREYPVNFSDKSSSLVNSEPSNHDTKEEQPPTPSSVEVHQEPAALPTSEASKLSEISPTESLDNSSSGTTYHGLSSDDILQLHLSGSEFEDSDMDGSLDQAYSADQTEKRHRDELSKDSDEDDDDSSDTDFRGGSLFPQSGRVAKLLEETLSKHNIAVRGQRSVQFETKLDIQEFDSEEPVAIAGDVALPSSSPTNNGPTDVQALARQYFQDSFIEDKQFLELHDHPGVSESASSPTLEPVNPTEEVSAYTQPIINDISERDPSKLVEASSLSFSSHNNDNAQIRQSYHRLRNNLIQKSGGFKVTESEQAVEPLEAPSKKKVSRFKAARLVAQQ